MQVQVPQVSLKDVEEFSKVWRKNNIILAILDLTSKEFARDFANVVLKSFVIEQAQRIMKLQQATQAAKVPPGTPVPSQYPPLPPTVLPPSAQKNMVTL